MKLYEDGPREMLPWGEMRLQRYGYTDGLFYTVETLKNQHAMVKTSRGNNWFTRLLLSTWDLHAEYSEQEWTRAAIARAKALSLDRVTFYDDNEYGYREEVIWRLVDDQQHARAHL